MAKSRCKRLHAAFFIADRPSQSDFRIVESAPAASRRDKSVPAASDRVSDFDKKAALPHERVRPNIVAADPYADTDSLLRRPFFAASALSISISKSESTFM